MTPTLVRLLAFNGSYRSMIQFGRLARHKTFQSKDEMLEVLNGILATQKRDQRITDAMMENIKEGSFDFIEDNALELTVEQAQLLGW